MITTFAALTALLVAPVVPAVAPAPGATTTHLTARSSSGGGSCSILTNAGNCYAAGEYCRQKDVGRSTTDADGAAITCVVESGRPHWHPAG